MAGSKAILTISRDKVLQYTRRLILEDSGYSVFDAHTDEEAIKAVEGDSYVLIVLCHSVPEKSRIFLVDKFKEMQPTLPIIMLYNSYNLTEAKVDGSLHNLDSPIALLEMIAFLIQDSRSPNAG